MNHYNAGLQKPMVYAIETRNRKRKLPILKMTHTCDYI